jgi:hypothetical protein
MYEILKTNYAQTQLKHIIILLYLIMVNFVFIFDYMKLYLS